MLGRCCFLVRKYPAQFEDVPYARENRPIAADDPPRLVVKKLLKAALASRPLLEVLHAMAHVGEAARAPEELLRRLYAGLLGLHLFRGFRRLVEHVGPQLSIAIVLHNSAEALPGLPALGPSRHRGRLGGGDRCRQRLSRRRRRGPAARVAQRPGVETRAQPRIRGGAPTSR